tara:strand:+ start:993 stop:1187 length:195 start_codon:yes stop_codon:yes gene_type:complete
MFKYHCKKCNIIKEIRNATIVIIDGKVRTKGSECDCGDWMVEIEKEFTGFPNLIRTEPSLKKRK